MTRKAWVFAMLATVLLVGRPASADGPLVAAAASLRGALPQIVQAYHAETSERVRVSFAASGTLARQIAQGAPFDVFLSADERFVLELAAAGHVADRGQVYALGRLAVVSRRGGDIALDGGLTGLRVALDAGRLDRLAIANPEHAPYGRAAREALTAAGLWASTQPHRVIGENVAQAAQFAVSGSRTVGLVAAALLHVPGLAERSEGAVVSETLYAPIRHRMVLVDGSDPAAHRFFAYLGGVAAGTVFEANGFALPTGGSRPSDGS